MDWAVVTDMSFRLWARWKYVPKINDDGWVVEASISMKDLGLAAEEGTIVGFNPCRFRHTVKPSQYMCWSTIGGRQKRAADYGHMILGDPPADMEDVLKTLYPNYLELTVEIPKGDQMVVYEQGKATTLSYAAMVDRRLAATGDAVGAVAERMGKWADGLKKAAEALEQAQGDLGKAATARAELEPVSEGGALGLLKELGRIEGVARDVSLDIDRAEILAAFREKLAASTPDE